MEIQRPSQAGRKLLIGFAYAGAGLLAILVITLGLADPMMALRCQ